MSSARATVDAAPLSLWLADIAANFLCIVVVLLVVVAAAGPSDRAADPPAPALPVIASEPLGGAALAELLRRRLLDDPGTLTIDLLDDGAWHIVAGAATPLGDDALNGAGPVVVHVFSPRAHAALAARLAAAGRSWTEATVPEALRAPRADSIDPADPATRGWAPAFLDLAADAPSPERFRHALTRLLVSGPGRAPEGTGQGGTGADGAGTGWSLRGSFDRLLAIGNLALAVTLTLFTLGIWSLGRRAARRPGAR